MHVSIDQQRHRGTSAVSLGMILGVMVVFAPCALAQPYPSRPITLISTGPVGSAGDLVARAVADELGNELGQRLVVDPKPVATGAVSGAALVAAKPDGYTLLFSYTSAMVINPHLRPSQVKWNPVVDMIPVADIGSTASLVTVRPDSPFATFAEFLQTSRQRELKVGVLNFSLPHFVVLGLQQTAKAKLLVVPYNTQGQMVTDLLSGDIDALSTAAASLVPLIKGGRMRAIAVTSSERFAELPDVPTIESVVPGFKTTNWFALFAPADTPPAIAQQINAAVNSMLAKPKVRAQLLAMGVTPIGGTIEQARERIAADYQRYATLVKDAGLKTE